MDHEVDPLQAVDRRHGIARMVVPALGVADEREADAAAAGTRLVDPPGIRGVDARAARDARVS